MRTITRIAGTMFTAAALAVAIAPAAGAAGTDSLRASQPAWDEPGSAAEFYPNECDYPGDDLYEHCGSSEIRRHVREPRQERDRRSDTPVLLEDPTDPGVACNAARCEGTSQVNLGGHHGSSGGSGGGHGGGHGGR